MTSTALRSLIDSATRLYQLDLRHDIPEIGADGLAVEAFAAVEALHTIGSRDLIVLSADAHLPLKTLLGQPATLRTSLADGSRASFSGLVCQAGQLGTDGTLARYRLRLVPWPWLLSQNATSRVWQDQSLIEIIDAVFARYAPHAAWTWSDETGPFLQHAPRHRYRNQYRESDLAFVTRLLAEDGIGWRIEEHRASPAGHRLVLFADSTQACAFPDDPTSASLVGGPGIRYHGPRAREQQDSICALAVRRSLHPASLATVAWHHESARIAAAGLPTRHPPGGPRAPRLESFDHPGTDTLASAADADHLARLHIETIEARHERWQARSTVRTLRPGTCFSLTQGPFPGNDNQPPRYAVTRVISLGINNLPTTARHSLVERLGPLSDLLCQCLEDALGEENRKEEIPGHDLGDEPIALRTLVHELFLQAQQLGYANRFDAIPAHLRWRPLLADGTGMRLNPKPLALGSQSAIVVGPDGRSTPNGADEICCDRLGRIRIRFHWQGPDGEAGATCWVRVAQRWAGDRLGSQFLPRIGQEVLVQFLDNDIDRPLVISALYNGQGEGGIVPTPGGKRDRQVNLSVYDAAHDHTPSAQGNLAGGHSPVWHGAGADQPHHRNSSALWGIRSKEFGGPGHNQLLFDDTDAQGRLQLKTTHAATELTLGHLIHNPDNYRGSLRGLGIELRTDAWGAVRGGQGLLLSTYRTEHQAQSRTPAGDNAPGIAQLKQASQLAERFSQAAQDHQTVAFASHLGSSAPNRSRIDDHAAPLKALLKAASGMVDGHSLDTARADAAGKTTRPADGKLPHSTDPILALSAKGGLGMTAGQNLQFAVGETTSFISGDDSQHHTGGAMRWHTGQAIGVLAGAVGPGDDNTGLQMIAANGPLDIQAQAGPLAIRARDQIDIVSAHSHIDWAAAKSISLSTADGANITIADGNITVQCPGKITIHAGAKSFVGPGRVSYTMPQFPKSICVECLKKSLAKGLAFTRTA